ncbi:unnamed protein product [Phytophthora lilii]|uniref:Unnamed protein product n=1 Tax=Phytophthora lilii TaxID=2077276 RepID=A0A9W6T8S7_9STRA|nr:unnamed protein product [Phytophthora lilii]
MIVARPKMYGPGEYIFPVVYQLHSTLPATFHLQRHPIGVMNAVHAQLEYVFYVCLTANQGVILEAQQAVVIQVAVLPNQPLMRLEMATPARRTDPVVASQQETNAFLSASLDKTAYRSGEVLRVRCRVNRQSGGRKSFTVFLRLYEDVDVTVAPSKHSEGSRLLCERSFQVAADATAFELALELVAVPGAPPIERMFCSSFVDRRHRLAVESFLPGSNSVAKCEIAVVILLSCSNRIANDPDSLDIWTEYEILCVLKGTDGYSSDECFRTHFCPNVPAPNRLDFTMDRPGTLPDYDSRAGRSGAQQTSQLTSVVAHERRAFRSSSVSI